MRRFVAFLLAFLVFAAPALALTPGQSILLQPKKVAAGGPPAVTYPAPCAPTGNLTTPCSPNGSAYFGSDNWMFGGTANNGLALPAGAMNVPATVINSWTLVFFFKNEDNTQPYYSASTQPFTPIANCAAATCSGGTDRFFDVTNPGLSPTQSSNREVLFSGKAGGTTLWLPPASVAGGGSHTGLNLVPNVNYCAVISQYGADSASNGIMSIAISDVTGTPVANSPVVTTTVNNPPSPASANFYYGASSGTPKTQASIGDVMKFIGDTDATPGSFQRGTAGPVGPVAMLWGVMPNTAGVPTASVLQSLCNGSQDIKDWALANGFTIHALYRLNDAPTWAGDPAGTVTAAAVAVGTVTQGSPVVAPQGLVLTEQGPGDVFRVEPGMSGVGATGTIYFKGTVSPAALGFTPVGIDGEVLSGGSPVAGGWQTITPGAVSSAFSGSISGVPAGGPYTMSVRPHNSQNYVYAGKYPVYVGLKVGVIGQSQQCVLYDPQGTGATLSVGAEVISTINLPLVDVGNAPTNAPGGHVGLAVLSAVNTPGGGSAQQMLGDGGLRLAKDLAALSGWPVQIVNFCKSGTIADAWAYDQFLTGAQALSGTGTGAYSGTLQVSQNIPGANFLPAVAILTGVKKGTLVIKDAGGATVATDTAGCADTCNLSGAGVSSGTINHLTGAVTGLNFTASQASPLTAYWTSIQDTVQASPTQQNPYVGFGVFGDGTDPASGQSTRIASRVSGPLSFMTFEQCIGNVGEVKSVDGSASLVSLTSKWNFTLQTRFPLFSWWRSNTPIVVWGYPRDGGIQSNFGGCRQFLQQYAAQGGVFKFGGSYWDNNTQASQGVQSPHEGAGPFGGMRMGRRMAVNLWSVQSTGVGKSEPFIASAAFKAGPDYNKIIITFTLPQGTSIATCGGALATSGVCTITTAAGTVARGFRIGLSTSVLYDRTGVDENLQAGAIDATLGFACTIASATTVECDKNAGGVWTSGSTFVQFMADGPFDKNGTVLSIATVPGSGYAGSSPFTITATGGGCSPEPQISATQTAGAIGATLTSVGGGCTSAPAFSLAHFTGGSGASVTPTLATPSSDLDDVGNGLYDNSGGFGGFEPGLPVTPVITPVSVSG